MNYNELKTELENAPRTWLPALLKTLVETSIKKRVFIENDASKFVARIQTEMQTNAEPPNDES